MTIILKNKSKNSHYPKQTEMACVAAINLKFLQFFSETDNVTENKFRKSTLNILSSIEIDTIEDLLAADMNFLLKHIFKQKILSFVLLIQRKLKSLTKRKISSDFYKLQKDRNLRYDLRLSVCIVRIFKNILTKIDEAFNELIVKISIFCSRNQLHIAKTFL